MQMNSVWLWPVLAGSLFVVAALAWLATRNWYAKKLVAAAHRLAKSDQGRLLAQKQLAQAMQQLQAARRELETEKKRSAVVHDTQTRLDAFESKWTATETFSPAAVEAPDFADTQILA